MVLVLHNVEEYLTIGDFLDACLTALVLLVLTAPALMAAHALSMLIP